MLFGSFPICVSFRLLRQLCRVRYYVRDKLAEALGVLRGDDRLAGFGFQRFSRNARDITAAPGDLLIFVKALRLFRFRNIPCFLVMEYISRSALIMHPSM